MFKLTESEKREIRDTLYINLSGTPVQKDRDLILSLILPTIQGWVENRDEIFKREDAS